jgi:hypothetical protein
MRPKRVPSAAITKSNSAVRPIPEPSTSPCTAATLGLLTRRILACTASSSSTKALLPSGDWIRGTPTMSPPAQNARPAALTRIAPTSGSVSACSMASASSTRFDPGPRPSAFSFSGRLRTTWATPDSTL